MSEWAECDFAVWGCELHGVTLRVEDSDKTERTDDILDAPMDRSAPWVWRVFRIMNGFTAIELESGREDTRDLAMIAAEEAAGTWR